MVARLEGVHCGNHTGHVLIHSFRTARLARDICGDLQSPLVALCVLKGGYQFFTDLLDSIKNYYATVAQSRQIEVDFIRLKSYVVGGWARR